MGQAKRWMEEQQDNRNSATSYLVDTGELEECEIHGDIFGGGDAKSNLDADFWRKAVYEKGKGDKGLVPWAKDMKQREFTDLISAAYDDHFGDDCGSCDHQRHKDD